MANEFTLNASLAYLDSELTDIALAIPADLRKTISTKQQFGGKLYVLTSEVAIPLGGIGTLGYYLAINRDTTNFVYLRVGTAGARYHRLDANSGFSFGRFGVDVTAPYAIADTATCHVDYILFAA